MPWFKVDDQLHEHRKARQAGKAAMGVWLLAGSWSMDNLTDGFIPADVVPRWGTKADAARLVAVGLWDEAERDGERGWQFHDWDRFQPPVDVMEATKEKESEAGVRGAHTRWHVKRKIVSPDCEFCHPPRDEDPYGVPHEADDAQEHHGSVTEVKVQSESDIHEPSRHRSGFDGAEDVTLGIHAGQRSVDHGVPYGVPYGVMDGVTDGVAMGSGCPEPEPVPTTTSNEVAGQSEPRADVLRICEYLADAIEQNGSKRPSITKGWHDEARRLLDLDGRAEDEVLRAIDWCQRGQSERAMFWRSNVLSMAKLRAKFDQMRLQAQQEQRRAQPHRGRAAEWLDLAANLGAEGPDLRQIGPSS